MFNVFIAGSAETVLIRSNAIGVRTEVHIFVENIHLQKQPHHSQILMFHDNAQTILF